MPVTRSRPREKRSPKRFLRLSIASRGPECKLECPGTVPPSLGLGSCRSWARESRRVWRGTRWKDFRPPIRHFATIGSVYRVSTLTIVFNNWGMGQPAPALELRHYYARLAWYDHHIRVRRVGRPGCFTDRFGLFRKCQGKSTPGSPKPPLTRKSVRHQDQYEKRSRTLTNAAKPLMKENYREQYPIPMIFTMPCREKKIRKTTKRTTMKESDCRTRSGSR